MYRVHHHVRPLNVCWRMFRAPITGHCYWWPNTQCIENEHFLFYCRPLLLLVHTQRLKLRLRRCDHAQRRAADTGSRHQHSRRRRVDRVGVCVRRERAGRRRSDVTCRRLSEADVQRRSLADWLCGISHPPSRLASRIVGRDNTYITQG